MKILIVKTTSMGDVVHALPAAADIRAAFPQAEIHWLVEEPFADIVRLSRQVDRVYVCNVRRWRRSLLSVRTHEEVAQLKKALRAEHYDLVIDLQGLMKSAALTRWPRTQVAGYDRSSAREGLASFFYDRRYAVSRRLGATERNRRLAGLALGYEPQGEPKFDFRLPAAEAGGRKVMIFANASRRTKLWPQDHWIALGRELAARGYTLQLAWNTPQELERVEEIARGTGGGAEVLPRLSIGELMGRVAASEAVIGLDTGMTHLSAAMGRPTVALYLDYPADLVPLVGSGPRTALGGVNLCPAVPEVLDAFEETVRAAH